MPPRLTKRGALAPEGRISIVLGWSRSPDSVSELTIVTAGGIKLFFAAMDDPKDDLTFDRFAEFIREFWHVSPRKAIAPETQFEHDLGLTGDDGPELLLATEKRFGVKLRSEETGYRETFNLGPNEYLFHSEGFEIFPFLFPRLFGSGEYSVRRFTVGDLFQAVLKARNQESATRTKSSPD